MDATRRQFLQNSSAALVAASAGSVFAQQGSESDFSTDDHSLDKKQAPTLVSIYLRGGADSLSMLVPAADDNYYKYRTGTAIPNQGGNKAVPFLNNKYFGLNPNMKSLLPLLEEGRLYPIVNAGSTHGTRSHFDAQDYMERAAPGLKSVRQGWLNRYLWMTKQPFDAPLRGIAVRRVLPRALRGRYPVLAGYNHTENMDLFEELYAESNLVNKDAREGAGKMKGSTLDDFTSDRIKGMQREQTLRTSDLARDIITESGTASVKRLKALYGALTTQRNNVNYPRGGLGEQLSQIARVIKSNSGLEVAQAEYGGWDTHSGQGGVNGRMGQLIKHVADSMRAFHDDLGPRMNKVMVMVMSEFGRTVHENGNNGTDHGHGSIIWVMGGMLKPNNRGFYGDWKGMEVDQLKYHRFMPVEHDFRIIFAESLYNMFGFDPFKADYFPGYTPRKGELVNFMNQVKV
jgi:uncharacterized protein (DUF1501 family)